MFLYTGKAWLLDTEACAGPCDPVRDLARCCDIPMVQDESSFSSKCIVDVVVGLFGMCFFVGGWRVVESLPSIFILNFWPLPKPVCGVDWWNFIPYRWGIQLLRASAASEAWDWNHFGIGIWNNYATGCGLHHHDDSPTLGCGLDLWTHAYDFHMHRHPSIFVLSIHDSCVYFMATSFIHLLMLC